jgi:hypothetical protein
LYAHRLVATGTVLQMDFIAFFKIMYVYYRFSLLNMPLFMTSRFHTHEKFVFSLPEFM